MSLCTASMQDQTVKRGIMNAGWNAGLLFPATQIDGFLAAADRNGINLIGTFAISDARSVSIESYIGTFHFTDSLLRSCSTGKRIS